MVPEVLLSAGRLRRGAWLVATLCAAACSREPAGSPDVAAGALPSARAPGSASPHASSAPATSPPGHIDIGAATTMLGERLVVLEPGPLGERRRPTSAKAALTAQGAFAGTFVVLDEEAPRPLLAARTPLALLVEEDAELAPGPHVLTAYQERKEGLAVVHLGFSLEDGEIQDVAAGAPRCLLALPRGTYRGTDARLIKVVPIAGLGADSLRLTLGPAFEPPGTPPLGGDGARKKSVRAWPETSAGPLGSSFVLRALESGDYLVTLECLSRTGAPSASRRVITIDAALEKPE